MAALSASALALCGAVISVPLAFADEIKPVADYSFAAEPADGKTVENTADGGSLGAAIVQNPAASLWKDGALTLSGGGKDAGGDWVRLPDNILAGKKSATVQTEVKADSSMLKDYHFLWNIGNKSSDTEYFFTALKCADGRTPLVGIKANGKEQLVQSNGCTATADQWLSVTAVMDTNGDSSTTSFYINGTKVASSKVAASTADVKDQTFSTIGRSPWPDSLFKGQIANFRVFDSALSSEQIATLSQEDAQLHGDEIAQSSQAILAGLGLKDHSVSTNYISLPTQNGDITWSSSNQEVITDDGYVTQPSRDAQPVDVVLTATATVRGVKAQKAMTVTVEPNDKTDEEVLASAASSYVVPSVLRSGDSLPAPGVGMKVSFSAADPLTVKNNLITTADGKKASGKVRANISMDSLPGLNVEKIFTVTVLPESTEKVLAYDRVATSETEANNGDIAYSMHLATQSKSSSQWNPLNENYGIFFARTAQLPPDNMNIDASLDRSLKDPSVFYMEDGSFGIAAVRTKRGTDQGDESGNSSILLATSKDLLSYTEKGNSGSIIDVGETNGVNKPQVVFDSADDLYVVSWTDNAGVPKYTTFAELRDSSSQHGDVTVGLASLQGRVDSSAEGIDNYRSGVSIPVEKSIVDGLNVRFGRITNTGYEEFADKTIQQGTNLKSSELPKTVTLNYSDGSTGSLAIDNWDLSGVDASKAGEYEAIGTVKQTAYPLPFAEERADPSVYKWEWKHDGKTETKYLMIATNDIYGDNVWQNSAPHMPVRMADSISALADVAGDISKMVDSHGYNPLESVLRTKGDKNTDGQEITGSFWAPEFHEINGKLTILFMPSYNNVWSDGASAFMQLKQGADGEDLDPTKAESWTDPQTIKRLDGSPISLDAKGNKGMSLDMTYFKDQKGNSYYVWQQLGAVYAAHMDPSDPGHITTDPVRIVAPEYAWDNAIAEGPNVQERNGKLYLIYSGSTVGTSYTTGLAVADASGEADLADPSAWSKLNYPIQKSGPYNGEMQLGTGHGMWSEDEDGNMIYVFHAYANKTEGYRNYSGRDMFVRRVHWASDGMPVLDMGMKEELSTSTVKLRVRVIADATEPDNPGADGGNSSVPGEGGSSGVSSGDGVVSPVVPSLPQAGAAVSLAETGSSVMAVAVLLANLVAVGLVLVGMKVRRSRTK